MNSGRLDRKTTLLRLTHATDGAGAPVETWTERPGIIWAEQVEIRGSEQAASGSLRADRALTLRVRYLSIFEAVAAPGEYRIRYCGRDYDLAAAVEDTRQPRRSYQLLTLTHIQGQPTLTSVQTV